MGFFKCSCDCNSTDPREGFPLCVVVLAQMKHKPKLKALKSLLKSRLLVGVSSSSQVSSPGWGQAGLGAERGTHQAQKTKARQLQIGRAHV